MDDPDRLAAWAEQQPPADVLLALRTELMMCTTVIRGFTDLAVMSEGGPRSEPPQEWGDTVRRTTDRMRWLLNAVMLPLTKRLMPDDEPRRAMIEAMMQQSPDLGNAIDEQES